MRQVEAISVYNPSDPLERAIQESFHATDGSWLSSYQCQTLAEAVASLKCYDDWLEDPKLLEHRIAYFFAPYMSRDKSVIVLPTSPIFVRDILENCQINAYLYDPIAFVTPPLAHYFFKDHPIHIYFNAGRLRGANHIQWIEAGGLMVSKGSDLVVDPTSITHVRTSDIKYTKMVESILGDINKSETTLSKVAITQLSPGVFRLDDHVRQVQPDDPVWDKDERLKAVVSEVGPGSTGLVIILYEDGKKVSVPKVEFDRRYIVG